MPGQQQDEDASVWLDRFVSATTAQDVRDSLAGIADALASGKLDAAAVLSDTDALTAILKVWQTSEYKGMAVDDSSSDSARIAEALTKSNLPALLEEPSEGRFLQALLDVACGNPEEEGEDGAASSSSSSTYSRVTACECLLSLSNRRSRTVTRQLLSAPNGLHRLSGLLLDADEPVRNLALLLASSLAENPAIAKNWMFQDVGSVVMKLVFSREHRMDGDDVGLTNGSILVQDCVKLLYNLVKHDAQFADLVLESSADILPALTGLLDLRQGAEFKYPDKMKKKQKKPKAVTAAASAKSGKDEEEEDDLDALLQAGSSRSSSKKSKDKQPSASETAAVEAEAEAVVEIPRLLQSEEDILHTVLDVISVIMEKEDIRRQVWKRHKSLVSMIWDMGMLEPPPPGQPCPCAFPSCKLQQRALQVTAQYLNSYEVMVRMNGLDRLLRIACTGGLGFAERSLDDKLALSMSALHVIRQTLPRESAQEMLAHSLAPPPVIEEGDDGEGNSSGVERPPPPPTAVQLLLNTVVGNLNPVPPAITDGSVADANDDSRKVCLLGATSAITIFLTDEASRSVFLRLAGSNLVEGTWVALMGGGPEATGGNGTTAISATTSTAFIQTVLLRFLAHWIAGAPVVVQSLLQSTQSSIAMSQLLFANNDAKNDDNYKSSAASVSSLACLLLGLFLQVISNSSSSSKKNKSITSSSSSSSSAKDDSALNDQIKLYGGWTVQGIMEMIHAMGVPQFVAKVESLNKQRFPWSACSCEHRIWSKWCEEMVFAVRQRIVQQMTVVARRQSSLEDGSNDPAAAGEGGETSPDDDAAVASSEELRSLQRLLAQQTQEVEELRQSLSDTKTKLAFEEKATSEWKRRVESTPTQLDEMLSEYTSKNSSQEKRILELEEELRKQKDESDKEIAQRDERIRSLEKTVQEARDADEESRQERDSLREELTALSSAYSTLEEEYRRGQQQQQPSTATASSGEQQGAEEPSQQQQQQQQQQHPTQQQAEGEGSTELHAAPAASSTSSGSTEVAALRADNARLRQNMKDADEWMAMAMERMAAIDQQYTASQQQVATLQAQLSEATSAATSAAAAQANEFYEDVERRLAEEHKVRVELEKQLASVEATSQQLLSEEQSRRQQVEEELSRQLDGERSQHQIDLQVSHEARAELEGTVQNLHAELNSLRQENDSLRRRQQQQQQQETASRGDTPPDEHGEGTVNPSAALEPLQTELQNARLEMERIAAREQEEIYKREARIRELEARLDGGLGQYTVEDIHRRDGEIEQLEKSNENAQEWMAKAVEHHQMLSNQVSELTKEKTLLNAEVRDLTSKIADLSASGDASSRLEQLENDLSLRMQEIEQNRSELALRIERIADLQSKLDRVSTELQQVQVANQRLMEETARLESLVSDREDIIQERDTLITRVQQLEGAASSGQQQAGEGTERIPELEAQVDSLQTQLTNYESEASAAIAVWKDKYDAILEERNKKTAGSSSEDESSAVIADLESAVNSLQTQLAEQERGANVAISQWQESYAALESNKNGLEMELQVLRKLGQTGEASHDGSSSSLLAAEKMEARIQSLEQQLADQRTEASNIIAQWQDSYNTVDIQRNELATKLNSLEQQEAAAAAKLPPAPDISPSELERKVHGLEEQLLDAEKTTLGWKDSYEALEADKAVLEQRLQQLEQDKGGAEEDASEGQAIQMTELEAKVKSLEQELEEQNADANNAIAGWQMSYTALETSKQVVESELEQLKKDKAAAVTGEEGEDHPELETKIKALEQELEEQRAEANDTIAGWQTSYTALETSKRDVESELEQLKTDKATASTEAEDEGEEQAVRIVELEAKVKAMEEELEVQDKEANDAIAGWQSSYTALEASKQVVESELEQLKKDKSTPSKDEDGEDHPELETRIKALEQELEEQRTEANDAISGWHTSYTALETSKKEVESELEQLKKDKATASIEAEDEGEEQAVRIVELEAKVKAMEEELEVQDKEANDAIAGWQSSYTALETSKQVVESELEQLKKDKAAAVTGEEGEDHPELEIKIKALEQELEEQRAEANDTIAGWQTSYTALETSKRDVESELEQLKTDKATASTEAEDEGEEQAVRISELEAKVKAMEQELEEQNADANNAIAGWQMSYTALETSKQEIESELEQLKKNKTAAFTQAEQDESEEHAIIMAELEAKVKAMEQELEVQDTEANNAISGWQTSYAALEASKEKVESELEQLKKDKAAASTKTEDEREEQSIRIAELDAKVQTLEQKLKEQTADANNAISGLQMSYTALETSKKEVENDLEQLKTDKAAAFAKAEEQASRIAELDAKVKAMEQKLKEQTADANNAISGWQMSYTALETSKKEVESELEQLKTDKAAAFAEAEEQASRIVELEGKVKAMEQELTEQTADANDAISGWQTSYTALETSKKEVESELEQLKKDMATISTDKDREEHPELEAKVKALEQELEGQLTDANNAIADWQSSYATLEASKQQVESELEQLKKDKAAASVEVEDKGEEHTELEAMVKAMEQELDEQCTELKKDEASSLVDAENQAAVNVTMLETKVKFLEQELEIQYSEAQDTISAWQDSHTALEETNKQVESELEQLKQEIAQRDADALSIAEYKAKIKALEEQLLDHDSKANATINSWQEKVLVLQSELESASPSGFSADAVSREASGVPEGQAIRITELETTVKSLEVQLAAKQAEVSGALDGQAARAVELERSEATIKYLEEQLSENQNKASTLSEEQAARISELEGNLKLVEGRLAEQEAQAFQWQDSYAALESAKNEVESELNKLKEKQLEKVQEDEALVTRIKDLEADLNQKNEELMETQQQQRAATESLHTRCKQLEDELSFLVDQGESYEGTIADRDMEIADLQRRLEDIQETDTTVGELKTRLEEAGSELNQLQERLDAQSANNDSLSEALKSSEKSLEAARDEIEMLKTEVEENRVDAENAIAEWESSYQGMEQRAVDLEGEVNALREECGSVKVSLHDAEAKLVAEKAAHDAFVKKHELAEGHFVHAGEELVSERDSFIEELGSLRTKVAMLDEQVATAEKDYEALEKDSEDAINQWKERVESLESSVQERDDAYATLESELVEQEAEAKNAIASWLTALEGEKDDLCTLLDADFNLKRKWIESLPGGSGGDVAPTVDDVGEDDIDSRIEQLKAKIAGCNSTLENLLGCLTDGTASSAHGDGPTLESLQKRAAALADDNAKLEKERDELSGRVQVLGEELRDALDAMQFNITNEVSDKATEIAAAALRHQVDEMRSQIEINRNALHDEYEARNAAEEEAGHLRADLAAILGVSNNEDMQSEIRFRAIQAREDFQRKERSEIEDMKEALSRTLDELESARAAEAAAEERASKANLQASVYEQEIVATKTDLKLLTEKMDEMRDAEASKRDSLEYRITTLQNDQDVVRRQHAAQTEKLQNELNHISMERDRLFESLKDSERNKEALLRAKSGREAASNSAVAGEEDLGEELTILRLEKAQLLVAASEEGARVERRLREARAAEQSSADADTILERELRLAAEKALENSKLEMSELRMEVQQAQQGSPTRDAHTLARERGLVAELQMELESLKIEVENHSMENVSLREQLEETKREAQETIDRLSEECRQSKTRVCQLEREGRMEAETQAEVSRLRYEQQQQQQVVSNGTANNGHRMSPPRDDGGGDASSSDNLAGPEIDVVSGADRCYDVIQKLRQANEEEVRTVHAQLYAEHEHLLGVLSHQVIIRTALKDALIDAAGQSAAADVLRRVREEAIERDGEFLDVE